MSVALVTGASSGIGARTAQLLATQGLTVFGAARSVDAVAALDGVTPVHLDLTDEPSLYRAVNTVEDAAGSVDVLVNCAGYGEFGTVEETTLEAARAQLEVNVLGAVGLIKAVLPGMRDRRRGRIVNVSSLAGEFAAPLGGWYHASKFALEALSDSLRGEVSRFGIDVTLVQPSYVDTDWHDTAMVHLDAASGEGPYRDMVTAMRRYFSSPALQRQTSSVEAVAELVAKAAVTDRPRTRYRIGPGAGVAVALATILPDRAFDALTRKQFGYARAERLEETTSTRA